MLKQFVKLTTHPELCTVQRVQRNLRTIERGIKSRERQIARLTDELQQLMKALPESQRMLGETRGAISAKRLPSPEQLKRAAAIIEQARANGMI